MSDNEPSSNNTRELGSLGSGGPVEAAIGRRFVVAIGIDRYANWPVLNNAVRDAERANLLFNDLGFESLTPPLVNGDGTAAALRELVTERLLALAPSDSLVLFFAGHGHTHRREFEDGSYVDTGYLVPVEAPTGGEAGAGLVRIDTWLSDVARLPPRHILVILDACHSGIALGDVDRWRGEPVEDLDALERRRSRRVITSALAGERALDNGPVAGHSLFTGCLIEAIQARRPPTGDAHAMTGSALAIDVQHRVRSHPGSQQIPDFGAFELDARGEIRIPLPRREPRPPGPRPPERGWRASLGLVRRGLGSWPIVGDLVDARALPRPGAAAGQITAGLAVTGFAWLAQARQLVSGLVGPTGAYFIWLLLPAAVVLLCGYAFVARDRDRGRGHRYRYVQPLRHVAKLAALVACVIAFVRIMAASPAGKLDAVEGYLCDERDQPLARAAVRLVDAAGRSASHIEESDDEGYFVVDVAAWSFRPLAVRVERPCGVRVARPLDEVRGVGCARPDLAAGATDLRGPLQAWKVPPCP